MCSTSPERAEVEGSDSSAGGGAAGRREVRRRAVLVGAFSAGAVESSTAGVAFAPRLLALPGLQRGAHVGQNHLERGTFLRGGTQQPRWNPASQLGPSHRSSSPPSWHAPQTSSASDSSFFSSIGLSCAGEDCVVFPSAAGAISGASGREPAFFVLFRCTGCSRVISEGCTRQICRTGGEAPQRGTFAVLLFSALSGVLLSFASCPSAFLFFSPSSSCSSCWTGRTEAGRVLNQDLLRGAPRETAHGASLRCTLLLLSCPLSAAASPSSSLASAPLLYAYN
mmetsp:Transcript_20110/g.27841  ORF Transcript_20110/g.27841 Transcript_20110/m.27841 type:complete len:281 (-) Transcript_20110:680-1522(-)